MIIDLRQPTPPAIWPAFVDAKVREEADSREATHVTYRCLSAQESIPLEADADVEQWICTNGSDRWLNIWQNHHDTYCALQVISGPTDPDHTWIITDAPGDSLIVLRLTSAAEPPGEDA
ncbi:MAG: hypothetical protein M3Z04_09735 [Chloroflexota bacterium]|nr:hypothetical protein [Chloroflexota bacterium]